MFYLTCTMISCVDLAHYGVSSAKDWVSVDCGTGQGLAKHYTLITLILHFFTVYVHADIALTLFRPVDLSILII